MNENQIMQIWANAIRTGGIKPLPETWKKGVCWRCGGAIKMYGTAESTILGKKCMNCYTKAKPRIYP